MSSTLAGDPIAAAQHHQQLESHPLAGPPSPELTQGSNDASQLPPSFQSGGTVRGFGTLRAGPSSKAATNGQRPNYFDLRRLAEQAEAEEAQRKAAAEATSAYAPSSAASSRASDVGGEDGDREDDGQSSIADEDEEDEEPPKWLRTSRPPSRAALASRHTIFAGGALNRPSSRASVRSPSSMPRRAQHDLFADMEATESQRQLTPTVGGSSFDDRADDYGEGHAEGEHSLQLLCSLRLMSDEDIDRHRALAARRQSSNTIQRPQPARTTSSGQVRKLGTAATSSPSQPTGLSFSNPSNNLVRDLSNALKTAVEQANAASAANQQAIRRQASVLAAQQKRSEAREAALKDIMLSMGVSEARITRALTHASAQAEVPVFRADERLADNLVRSSPQDVSMPSSSKSLKAFGGGDDEQLPQSLREAMLEDLESGLGIDMNPKAQPTSVNLDLPLSASNSSSQAVATAHAAKIRQPVAIKASEAASSRTHASVSPAPSQNSGKSVKSSSPSKQTVGSQPASSSTANSFGWASNLVPWGSGSASSKKAAASVQAHSPAAVEADGYLSDGAGRRTSPPRSPTPRRPHTRSASISAVFSSINDDDDDDVKTPLKAPSSSSAGSGAMGFGLLGSLAWRRKKSSGPSIRATAHTVDASLNKSEPDSPVSQFASSSVLDNESVVETLASESDSPFRDNNEDTIRAKASPLRPQAQYTLSGRDVSQALHEAIESPPGTLAVESLQRQLAHQDRPNPPHFKAIFLATRIMTPDPTSLLLDSGKRTSELVATLAMRLVGRAREEGIVVEEKSNGVQTTSRRPSMPSRPPSRSAVAKGRGGTSSADKSATDALRDIDARPSPPAPVSMSASSSTAATLGRALGKYRKAMYNQQKTGTAPISDKIEPNVTRLPQMFGLPASAAPDKAEKEIQQASEPVNKGVAPSVELEPILPNDVKPPTLAVFARRGAALRSAPPRAKRSGLDPLDEEESSGDEFEVYGGKGLVQEPPEPVGSRFQDTSELLTDRYGFVYDATPADVRLLRRARRAATPAPACLTGIRVGVRARGGSDSQSDEEDKDEVNEADADSDEAESTKELEEREGEKKATKDDAEARDVKSGEEQGVGEDSDVSNSGSLHTTSSRKTAGTSTTNGLLAIAPPKPVAQAFQLSVPSQTTLAPGPTSPEQEREMQFPTGQPSTSSLSAAPAQGRVGERPHSTSQTVKRLLGQLQEMHETQQSTQQAQWDDFLRRRRENMRQRRGAEKDLPSRNTATSLAADVVRKGSGALGLGGNADQTNVLVSTPPVEKAPEEDWSVGLVGFSQLTALANASSASQSAPSSSSGVPTSVGSAGQGAVQRAKTDLAEFLRLVQGGIPLVYRSKIWVECSGANEVAEPGRYQELLDEHEGESNQCTDQIDLDVGRTMPTNVYFGGEGPGVVKLRRLLVAFSWYNPRCGYCQGEQTLLSSLFGPVDLID